MTLRPLPERKKGITYPNQLDIIRRLAYRLTTQANDPLFIKRWDRSNSRHREKGWRHDMVLGHRDLVLRGNDAFPGTNGTRFLVADWEPHLEHGGPEWDSS